MAEFTAREQALIESLVEKYLAQKELVERNLKQLRICVTGSNELMQQVHSLRWRLKDPDHLRGKLQRKLRDAKAAKKTFAINPDNLLAKVNDLAGIRILHLHTSQIVEIDKKLNELFAEHKYKVIEKAKARTWDDEYRSFYRSAGIKTVGSPKMYTSVHYVVAPYAKTLVTCEIQVRTLAEELWGEVDHSMNYPHDCEVQTCREQIKVLARVTSSCSRLVDSIFAAKSDGVALEERRKVPARKKGPTAV